jgi:serine/threonine protein kinase/Tol biopolymer transport system component
VAFSPIRYIRFDPFVLDLRVRELSKNGIKLRVPDQSIQVLAMLLEHPGEMVSRENLYATLWPNGTIVDFDNSINGAIRRLRQVLDDSAEEPRFIETLPRRGYRFIFPVDSPEAVESNPFTEQRIAHFLLLRKLGEGARGIVYQAEDTNLGRSVAVKCLRTEFVEDELALARFRRESQTAASLNHPNICTVHEIGVDRGLPFIVMEYVSGRSLDHLIESDQIPVDTALSYAIQITEALAKAHSHGVVHRDIKPANIMVAEGGALKLLDFGLAKVLSTQPTERQPPVGNDSLTIEATFVGTVQYMAPEQLDGRRPDERTDIFALGAVIYEMLTGRKVFDGDTQASQIAAVLTHEIPPCIQLRPATPPELSRVVATCLAKDPQERWQTAAEVLRELRGIAAGLQAPITRERDPQRPSTIGRLQDREWTRPTIAFLFSVVLLIALIGSIFYMHARSHVRLSIEAAHLFKLTDNGAAEIVAIAPDGHYVAYTKRHGEKVGIWLRQITGNPIVESGIGILEPDTLGIWGLTFSPNGNYLYFIRELRREPFSKYLYTMPTFGGSVQLVLPDVHSPISFSPDGREFVFERNLGRKGVEIRISDTHGSKQRLLTTIATADTAVYHPGPSWSPDGKAIAVPVLIAGVGWNLEIIDVTNGSVQDIYSNPLPIGRPIWLSDRDTLLFPRVNSEIRRGELWTIQVSKRRARRLTNDLTDYSPRVDVTRDGLTAAATASTWLFNIWTYDSPDLANGRQITSGEVPMLAVVEMSEGVAVSISQDGHVYVIKNDGRERSLLTSERGSEPLDACGNAVVFGHGSKFTRIDANGASTALPVLDGIVIGGCTPDGKSIIYVTSKEPQKLVRVPIGSKVAVELSKIEGSVVAGRLAISPDGRYAAYVSIEQGPSARWMAIVAPLTGGPPVTSFTVPGGIRELSWAPNGQALQYLMTQDGATNIWEHPLNRGAPRQITHFKTGLIFAFSWSADHKRLLMTRGTINDDIVIFDFHNNVAHT